MAETQTVEDLGKLVKQKYPGAYDSLPDVEVGRKVKAKYPQYAQFADIPEPQLKRRAGGDTRLTPSQKLSQRRYDAATSTPEERTEAWKGVGKLAAEGAAMGGTAALGFEGAGALASGSLRPIAGIGASLLADRGTEKLASYLGAPRWLSETLGGVAGVWAGERVGLSAEMRERLSKEGWKGIVNRWVNGEPKKSQLEKFWADRHPGEPFTSEAAERAKVEAALFRKKIRQELEQVTSQPKSPEPFRPNPNIARKMTRATGEVGESGVPSYQGKTPSVKPSERQFRKPFEPVRPKSGVTRASAGSEMEYGSGYRNKPSPRSRLSTPEGATETPKGKTTTIQHLRDRGPLPETHQADQLARWLKAKGVNARKASGMSQSDWRIAAASAGLPEPSASVIEAARGQLGWR